MVRNTRTDIVKPLIVSGHIQEFKDIFIYLSKTQVAKDIGIGFNRFNKFLGKVQDMKLSDLYLLSTYFEIDAAKMFELINNQNNATKKGIRKK
jgi:hypothetical protein